MIEIREETASHIPAIQKVNDAAFDQQHEGRIVDALRSNGAARLSLVATVHGEVVGHIMYSPVTVGHVSGAGLAPMAVLPKYQRQGIGSRLIEAGTQKLKESGCPFIVVLGHENYYPRFGFKPASHYRIHCEWDVPEDAFMVLVLNPTIMQDVSGLAQYRFEFSTVT